MTAVTYTAKRSLISGHSAGSTYSLNLSVLVSSPGFSRDVNNVTNESINGSQETLRFFATKTYQVNLAPLKGGSPLNAVLEFLDSVEGLETFTWDFYGTVAVPNAAVTAQLEKGGYQLARYNPLGAGGATDDFTLSFRVRVRVP